MADAQPLWKPEYCVGLESIDQQHQRLFSLLQDLTLDDPVKSHAVLVQEVEDYINFHFAHEQHLMSKYRYPRMQVHLDQHQDFHRQFQLLQAGAKTDAKQLARIRLMVYAWFTRHILGDTMDRDLGAWLQARGLPAA